MPTRDRIICAPVHKCSLLRQEFLIDLALLVNRANAWFTRSAKDAAPGLRPPRQAAAAGPSGPCCPHLRVRGLAFRPASGLLETAELAHQARDQRPECAAGGDRPPPAALAGTPPVAALARGDLPGLAGPEPAPALHAPDRASRLD